VDWFTEGSRENGEDIFKPLINARVSSREDAATLIRREMFNEKMYNDKC
jgi:hypothetical protein